MATDDNVTSLVEYLRNKMVRLAEFKRDLGNDEVIQVSQQLDLYLLQIQLLEEAPAGQSGEPNHELMNTQFPDTFSVTSCVVKPLDTAVRA